MKTPSIHFPEIYIIILNWNGRDDTLQCLESLEKIKYSNYKIIVVDNGSSDGSRAIIRNRYPQMMLIENKENLGYAGGNNVGIQDALRRGAEYVVILNNDTVVDPMFLDELLSVASSDPLNGMVCPKIYFYHKPDVLWFAGAFQSLITGIGRNIGFDEKDRGQYDEIREIDMPCGCALMISRRVIEKIGLMDPSYFCYCEEFDWALRSKRAGFKIAYVPKSKVWHKVAASSGGSKNIVNIYYNVRNLMMLVRKHRPLKLWLLNHLRNSAIIFLHLVVLFTRNLPKIQGMRYILWGTVDYYKGNFYKGRLDYLKVRSKQ